MYKACKIICVLILLTNSSCSQSRKISSGRCNSSRYLESYNFRFYMDSTEFLKYGNIVRYNFFGLNKNVAIRPVDCLDRLNEMDTSEQKKIDKKRFNDPTCLSKKANSRILFYGLKKKDSKYEIMVALYYCDMIHLIHRYKLTYYYKATGIPIVTSCNFIGEDL